MSSNQTAVCLVLHANNKTKRMEISDKPKKVSHIPIMAQTHFDLFSNTCEYSIHFNDQKQELTDDDMDLTQFYSQAAKVEIHINVPFNPMTGSNSWA